LKRLAELGGTLLVRRRLREGLQKYGYWVAWPLQPAFGSIGRGSPVLTDHSSEDASLSAGGEVRELAVDVVADEADVRGLVEQMAVDLEDRGAQGCVRG
jgi:hypothetical protein